MINQVGRDIPDFLLTDGRQGYAGNNALDGLLYHKAAPTVRACVKPQEGKLVGSLTEALKKCGIRDGMYISFHHHFRDGDYVVNMVVKAIAELGIRDITICATSLGDA
ncbi:MAG: citrate lyase subunit alpha, partial [Oscillospiraceae bacterium]